MSTATAIHTNPSSAQASELLDVLYEILASGLEPESATVSVSDIEAFLHQHARAPKSQEDIETFFTSGGLPMQVDALARDSGLRLAAVVASTVSASTGDLPAPESTTGRHVLPVAAKAQPAPSPVAMLSDENASVRRGMSGTSLALLGMCLALAGVCVVGAWSVMGLRDALARSQAAQERTMQALERVQAHADQMGRQIGEQNKAIADQRADLDRLVQTFSLENTVP